MSPLLYACVITGLGISNSRQGKEREVVLHKIIFVAHSVARIGAKTAQNTPFRCSTVYRKLLICFRWGYYLANFKTAAFNHSATPPHWFYCTCGNQRCTFFTCFFTFLARTKQTDDTLERRSQIDFKFRFNPFASVWVYWLWRRLCRL